MLFTDAQSMGAGPIGIALWDLVGRKHGVQIGDLLGTYRDLLPACASTSFRDSAGGLDSPEALTDFAEQCRALD